MIVTAFYRDLPTGTEMRGGFVTKWVQFFIFSSKLPADRRRNILSSLRPSEKRTFKSFGALCGNKNGPEEFLKISAEMEIEF